MYGVIDINKKNGYTSHDVVNIIRKTLNIKKVGHSGTLDPSSQGVLNIYINKATKFIDIIKSEYKTYEVDFELNKYSKSLDLDTEVYDTNKIVIVDDNALNSVLKKFLGETYQTPPMYSAVRVGGVRLYKLAREGLEIKRKKRKINIKSIKLLSNNGVKIKLEVECSKGTYIRSLVEDIAMELNTRAVMTNLIRIKNDNVSINNTYNIDKIVAMKENLDYTFIRSIDLYSDLRRIKINEKLYKMLKNGVNCKIDNEYLGDRVILYNTKFLGTAIWKNSYYIREKVI